MMEMKQVIIGLVVVLILILAFVYFPRGEHFSSDSSNYLKATQIYNAAVPLIEKDKLTIENFKESSRLPVDAAIYTDVKNLNREGRLTVSNLAKTL